MNSDAQLWVDRLLADVEAQLARRPQRPTATYRLQFTADLGFRAAAALVAYLSQLGVSHLYASPYLRAAPGSQHGYDVCDHGSLNPELGTDDDFAALVAALQAHGLGQLLDVVPNHMSIGTDQNAWWNDVLANGPSSPYAAYFDIDWRPAKKELTNRVLLPVLGEQYGDALESGQLQLVFTDGAITLQYLSRTLPLDPATTIPVLAHRLAELQAQLGEAHPDLLEYQSILSALGHLPARIETAPDKVEERRRESEVIKRRLRDLTSANPAIFQFIADNLRQFNGLAGRPSSFDLLDALLDAQAYRLSHWKVASDEVNYRRFFDINELAALCMENPEVFAATHNLVFDLVERAAADGLRIDHIDGLYDPTEYLVRLQLAWLARLGRASYERLVGTSPARAAAPLGARAASAASVAAGSDPPPAWQSLETEFLAAARRRWLPQAPPIDLPPDAQPPLPGVRHPSRLPLYVVVEKVLDFDESLPEEWPVAGTTGYEFLNALTRLLVDPRGFRELEKQYVRFTGELGDFAEVCYRSKLLILQVAMSSELQMLANRLNRISESDRRWRDFTLNTLRHALRSVLACFPVYRTYVGPRGVSERDRRFIQLAVARAMQRNPAVDSAVFRFVRQMLLLEYPPTLSPAEFRQRELFVGRVQQVTSPAEAKGVEDTAFYLYFPLLSLNEVGGQPRVDPDAVAAFHRENLDRHQRRGGTLLTTTTHDTKRSEDVRARISVLSEVPHLWRKAANRWWRLNRRHHREHDGLPAPSRNDEYLFYQTLVGVWPLDPPQPDRHAQLVARLQQYMEKATREAKVRTSWINPNPGYDEAVQAFVAAVLEDSPGNRFLDEFRRFHRRIVDWGQYTALAQTALKLLSPGVPDIYQGQEIWDDSLVDPDNRRPVDFACRQWLLGELLAAVRPDESGLADVAAQLAPAPHDNRLKLFVTWRALQLRRKWADLFAQGQYLPLDVTGLQAEHVCAFAWRDPHSRPQRRTAIVVVPRLLAQLTPAPDDDTPPPPPIGPDVWHDAALDISALDHGNYRNQFTGERLPLAQPRLPLARALSSFPIALLTNPPATAPSRRR